MIRIPDALVGGLFEPLWDLYEGSKRLKIKRELDASQWWPAERIMAHQNRRLAQLVAVAAERSPHYREKFQAAGIDPRQVRSIADLAGLPTLQKDDLRNQPERILNTDFCFEDLDSGKTGGSTGVSLKYYCHPETVQQRLGGALRTDEWSGWKLGGPVAAVWGNPPEVQGLKMKLRTTLKERWIYLDTMKVNDQAIDRFVQEWEQMRPTLLYGHAHSIFLLADNLLRRGISLRPQGIVSTSMMLIDSERSIIEEAFAIPVTNRYGCEEVSLIASECEEHRGMHLNAEQKIVEFLDEEGRPCAPGQNGRIVVTDLTNFAWPLIRYEVGDMGIPTDRLCSCGRGLPLMESLTGRTADFLVAQDGSRVAGISLIENTLTKFQGIRQLQIVQDQARHLTVNLVEGAGYGSETAQQLVSSFVEYLGPDFTVDIQLVERIPQESSGKYRFAKCMI